MIEPYFLDFVSKFTFVEPDREIAEFVGLARSQASKICVIEHFGSPVLVR